jgi:predicted HicB family RNase H-like nuclease
MPINLLKITNHTAIISYDPESYSFRGEFIGLNGGADFYASSVDALHREGAQSLAAFLEVCRENGIKPLKSFSGKFNARIPPEMHEKAVLTAAAQGKSLNEFVKQALEHEMALSSGYH